MENLLRPYDKEYIRTAMLKHEETFKHQLYELHRLYRIQETLMRSTERSRPNGSFSMKNNYHHGNISMHHNSRTGLDLEHPAAEADHQGYNVAESDIEESEIELTLGPTEYSPRKKHGTPRTSDSGPSFSSSSTESSHMKKTSTTREDFSGNDDRMGLFQVTGRTLRYQNGSKNNNQLGEHLRQDRLKSPPWLFQVLSMNAT
ncbi:Class III peroxidase [Hibiscus syriacus]|uniref:Class III peroxidase n=1 Tax=Hibiscus syriacus TaxID=106335 RepID=A0A6A3C0P8_HIBSY|nr:uncharacterized protein LOC120206818 [Hibiscus syriacus]XP_039062329.1 uncharacterized protein LOC120206818 [Hibiscus syriacus]KAE8722394.1 Class III peroxidase [Hibiscus syriacus]